MLLNKLRALTVGRSGEGKAFLKACGISVREGRLILSDLGIVPTILKLPKENSGDLDGEIEGKRPREGAAGPLAGPAGAVLEADRLNVSAAICIPFLNV